ncbi:MAG: hypothetical protein INF92_15615 [Rhodobacter sp.]|nr:hypothetical protein [Rhodobacter sp.]
MARRQKPARHHVRRTLPNGVTKCARAKNSAQSQNALRFRIAGEKGGLAWEQENPDLLEFTLTGEATRLLRRGDGQTRSPARIPSGHPEGYLEAFATLYADAADMIGGYGAASGRNLATAEDGFAGVRFITACVRSNDAGGLWMPT